MSRRPDDDQLEDWMKELPDEIWDAPAIQPWDVQGPSVPGRAGSGLIGCSWTSAIPVAIIAAIGLLLVGGTAGLIIAAVVAVPWLLFTLGAVWQIIEMRRAGGYTRILPPDLGGTDDETG